MKRRRKITPRPQTCVFHIKDYEWLYCIPPLVLRNQLALRMYYLHRLLEQLKELASVCALRNYIHVINDTKQTLVIMNFNVFIVGVPNVMMKLLVK
jgi:hypothetical protein